MAELLCLSCEGTGHHVIVPTNPVPAGSGIRVYHCLRCKGSGMVVEVPREWR